jgi:hypothetical protein
MKREYLKKIFKILSGINDMWVLEQVYRCAVNITKQEDAE